MRRTRNTLLATTGLVVAAAIWGSTFVLVKEAVEEVPPFQFLAMRFAIATVVLALVWRRSVAVRAPGRLRTAVIVGTLLAGAYAFQTWGLVYTGATNAGFITGLYVVFTPMLAAAILRRAPAASALVGVALATLGLVLLSLRLVGGRPSFTAGDLLVLVCAAGFAAHIVALGRYAPGGDTRRLAIDQLAVATVVFAVLTPTGGIEATIPAAVWVALAVTALGATAYGFAIQTWAQAHLSPTRTAVILALEPAFAALFGYWWLAERLSVRGWIGAGLILAGMLAAEIHPAPPDREA